MEINVSVNSKDNSDYRGSFVPILSIASIFSEVPAYDNGTMSIGNCCISLLLLWSHHFIRSILRGKSLVFNPVMPVKFLHTTLIKKPLLKRCSKDSPRVYLQHTQLVTVGLPNAITLSSVGSLFLKALHRKKYYLNGIFLFQVFFFEKLICFFSLIISHIEPHVTLPELW